MVYLVHLAWQYLGAQWDGEYQSMQTKKNILPCNIFGVSGVARQGARFLVTFSPLPLSPPLHGCRNPLPFHRDHDRCRIW